MLPKIFFGFDQTKKFDKLYFLFRNNVRKLSKITGQFDNEESELPSAEEFNNITANFIQELAQKLDVCHPNRSPLSYLNCRMSQERRQKLAKLCNVFLNDHIIKSRNVRNYLSDYLMSKKAEFGYNELKEAMDQVHEAYTKLEKEMRYLTESRKKEIIG
ncbi:MAG: hypothetical protein MHPSP_002129 [Paramarteilia canceri]